MKCPNCSQQMVTLEITDVEVDHCFNCQGIWLDMGELKQLFQSEHGKEEFPGTISTAKPGEKKKKCPVCRKAMEKVLAGQADPVLLDRCIIHGFWFDEGELNKALALSCREEISSPLLRLLDDMFAARKGGCT